MFEKYGYKPLVENEDYRPMVTVRKINKIFDHPNADKLDLCMIDGWQVVIQKNIYKDNDLVLYFEIDSVLPEDVEDIIFGKDAKIKLSKSRVKTIKIRGQYSQGLIVPLVVFEDRIKKKIKEGLDVTSDLNVVKYEEPIKENNRLLVAPPTKKKWENPNFRKVRKPSNIKDNINYAIGKDVIITEKIHGSSFVCGWVKRPANNWKDRIYNFFAGEYEFCFRSMNVQMQRRQSIWFYIFNKLKFKKNLDFYEKTISTNIYSEAVEKYDLKKIIPFGYEITGEIYGSGIQKGYTYGCSENERKLICFGVRKEGINVLYYEAFQFIKSINLDYVPFLHDGILTEEILKDCTNGKSTLNPKTKVKEGCVIEIKDSNLIFKSISEAYLMGDNTDFH